MRWNLFFLVPLFFAGCQTAGPKLGGVCNNFSSGSCGRSIPLIDVSVPKSMFGDSGRLRLSEVAEFLKSNPEIRVAAEGHVNSSGDTDEDIARSQRIAIYAKEYLVAHGVESSRIESIAFGAEKPAREPASKLENLRFNAEFYDPRWCGTDVKSDCPQAKGR